METSGDTVPEVSAQQGDPGEEFTATPNTQNNSMPDVVLSSSESAGQPSQSEPAQNLASHAGQPEVPEQDQRIESCSTNDVKKMSVSIAGESVGPTEDRDPLTGPTSCSGPEAGASPKSQGKGEGSSTGKETNQLRKSTSRPLKSMSRKSEPQSPGSPTKRLTAEQTGDAANLGESASSPERSPERPQIEYNTLIQLRELEHKNHALRIALAERTREANEQREVAEAQAALQQDDAHAAKIIELSRKARHMHLGLEREKSRAAALEEEVQKLKLQNQIPAGGASDGVEAACRELVQKAGEQAEAAHKEAVEWRDKWEQALQKANQFEVKVGKLKSEKEALERALKRELGSDVDLNRVLDESSGWRGRAQQIALLKDRIAELLQQQGSEDSAEGHSKHDVAHRSHLDTIKGEKQREIDRLKIELGSTHALLVTVQKKLDGSTARRTIMENEVKSLKDALTALRDKSTNDDQLIMALRGPSSPSVSLSKKGSFGAASANDTALLAEIQLLQKRLADRDSQLAAQERSIAELQATSAGQWQGRVSGGPVLVEGQD